jgi:hypothetical protein
MPVCAVQLRKLVGVFASFRFTALRSGVRRFSATARMVTRSKRRFRAKTKNQQHFGTHRADSRALPPSLCFVCPHLPCVAGFVWLSPEVKDKSQPTRQTGVFQC